MNDKLIVGKYEFNSRLIVGSGKYKDFQTTKEATLASGSELITVAIRRVNITNPNEENLLDYFKGTNIKLLPNSAGCFTAEEAITAEEMRVNAFPVDMVTAAEGTVLSIDSVPPGPMAAFAVIVLFALLHAALSNSSE